MLLPWLFPANRDVDNGSLAEERAMSNASACEQLLAEKQEPEWTIEECDDSDFETCTLNSITDLHAATGDKYADIPPFSVKERRLSTTSITFSEDNYHVSCKLRSASAPPSLPALDGATAYEDTCVFHDEEKYGDSADTFVIPPHQAPLFLHERNGTLGNELAAGVRAPFTAMARAGRSGKRKMCRLPGAMKRTFDSTADATTSKISENIKSFTRNMDVPNIGDTFIGEIFRAPQHIAALKQAGRQALKKLDNSTTPSMFVPRKHRAGSSGWDYDVLERMQVLDAARLFAREMGVRARRALVEEGICEDYRVVDFLAEMQFFLVRFYIAYKPHMAAEELMEADLRWAAGGDFFSLELEAIWPRGVEREVMEFGWEATGFCLFDSQGRCKTTAAAYLERNMPIDGGANGGMDVSVEDIIDMYSDATACDGASMDGDTEIENDL